MTLLGGRSEVRTATILPQNGSRLESHFTVGHWWRLELRAFPCRFNQSTKNSDRSMKDESRTGRNGLVFRSIFRQRILLIRDGQQGTSMSGTVK
jgi:hypothetical protein